VSNESECRGAARSHRQLIFEDHFDGRELDRSKWLAYYLPHWSTLEAARACFRIAGSSLRLFIADDQAPWCPDHDGQMRVSNLQTGHFSGPIGSRCGQHRFRSDLTVCSEHPELRLFLPQYCRLEMRARARLNPWNLAALWLIGFEDQPDRSGEITIFEAFGQNISEGQARIGRGIKKIGDPKLTDEIDDSQLPISVEDWHVYAIEWTPFGVAFLVDGVMVTQTTQSPNYPMQVMLNFYDLPGDHLRSDARNAWFEVDYIKAYAGPS